MVEGQSFHLTIRLWPDKDQNNMTKLFYTCFKLYFIDYQLVQEWFKCSNEMDKMYMQY